MKSSQVPEKIASNNNFLSELLVKKSNLRPTNTSLSNENHDTFECKTSISEFDNCEEWKYFRASLKSINIKCYISSERTVETRLRFEAVDLSNKENKLHLHVEDQIGRGKFASVFKVETCNLSSDKNVTALKVAQFIDRIKKEEEPINLKNYLEKLEKNEKEEEVVPPKAIIKQFAREIRALYALSNHSNIVQLDFILSKPFSIALEFVDGGNLATYLNDEFWQSKSSMLIRFCILRDIASGLDHMKKNGFVHRDLKPHNIVVSSLIHSYDNMDISKSPQILSGLVFAKLCDFGTCLKIDFKTEEDRVFDWLDKIEDEIVGTSGYTAPEVLSKADISYGYSSDLYSFGIICWETTSSDRNNPYKGKEPDNILMSIALGVLPIFQKNIPIFIEKLVFMLLSIDTSQRPLIENILLVFDQFLSSTENFMHIYDRIYFINEIQPMLRVLSVTVRPINH